MRIAPEIVLRGGAHIHTHTIKIKQNAVEWQAAGHSVTGHHSPRVHLHWVCRYDKKVFIILQCEDLELFVTAS